MRGLRGPQIVDLSRARGRGGLALRCSTGGLHAADPHGGRDWGKWTWRTAVGAVWEKGPEQVEERLEVAQVPCIPGVSWRQVGQQLPGSCTASSPCRGGGPQSTQEGGPTPPACLLEAPRPASGEGPRKEHREPSRRAAGGYLGTGEDGAGLGADTPPTNAAAALTGLLPLGSGLRKVGRAFSPSFPFSTFLLYTQPEPSLGAQPGQWPDPGVGGKSLGREVGLGGFRVCPRLMADGQAAY